MNPRRKLVAILFADIVGYTKQSHNDESRTLRLRERVERLIRDCTATNNGRVIKTIGDAVMVEFISAVDAVSCALSIQERVGQIPSDGIPSEPVQLRIGVHVGDVVEEDNDLFGNAVNIAQRIQSMAQPGAICISREVYTQIRPILKLQCHVVTEAPSKPLPEPVEVLTITSETLPDRNAGKADRLPEALGVLLFCLFFLIWAVTMPLWVLGTWGGVIGGATMGLLLWPLLRCTTDYLPHLRMEPAIRQKGARHVAGALLGSLIVFGLCGGCASTSYMMALEEDSMRGWGINAKPWNFSEQNKGQEYHLLNALKAFNGNPPQTTLVFDARHDSSWDSTQTMPQFYLPLGVPMTALWLFCGVVIVLGAGREGKVFQRDSVVARQWSTTSLVITAGLMLSLFLLWTVGEGIGPMVNKTVQWPQKERYYHAAPDRVIQALEHWFHQHGYVIPASQGYAFKTVPQEKIVATAMVYRACKADWNARWRRNWLTWESRSPLLYVECIGSDKLATTVIRVSTGAMVANSPTNHGFEREWDDLTSALQAEVNEHYATH